MNPRLFDQRPMTNDQRQQIIEPTWPHHYAGLVGRSSLVVRRTSSHREKAKVADHGDSTDQEHQRIRTQVASLAEAQTIDRSVPTSRASTIDQAVDAARVDHTRQEAGKRPKWLHEETHVGIRTPGGLKAFKEHAQVWA